MAVILKGAPVAEALTEKYKSECESLLSLGVAPCLAILRVGERPDDISYEKAAIKRCEKIGIKIRSIVISAESFSSKIEETIKELNEDPSVHGVLMFRPLPDPEVEEKATALLAPEKDVDGMTMGSLGAVFSGKGKGFAPCTAVSVMEILDYYGIDLTGKNVVVIGRSLVIGKPVSMLLQRKNATVTMCHTKTKDLPGICKNTEIIVAAAGVAKMVTRDFVDTTISGKEQTGQVIVDVGINVDEEGHLLGDVDFDGVEPFVSYITPVPGGVGAVTTAVLAGHVIDAAKSIIP